MCRQFQLRLSLTQMPLNLPMDRDTRPKCIVVPRSQEHGSLLECYQVISDYPDEAMAEDFDSECGSVNVSTLGCQLWGSYSLFCYGPKSGSRFSTGTVVTVNCVCRYLFNQSASRGTPSSPVDFKRLFPCNVRP
jgi:hypothetical protein